MYDDFQLLELTNQMKMKGEALNTPTNLSAMNRREALKIGAGFAIGTSLGAMASEAAPQLPDSPWTAVRGFNYHPSYGSNGFELWQKFDAKVIETELARCMKYFPKINALRWWQSWDSFTREPKRYARDFDTTLDLAAKYGLKVMPVLFNRWHDFTLDYGGIYLEHFFPRWRFLQRAKMFDAFMDALVGRHAADPRILSWDLCNEPFNCPEIKEADNAEYDWLAELYTACKKLGAKAPVTIGISPAIPLARVEPISDLLSIHPYWVPDRPKATKEGYEKDLDRDVAFALKANKPLLATETCWGSLDDRARVELVRYTLEQLKKRNIGSLVYLLHHSLIADAHRPEFGPVGEPGNLSFIEADGSLRPGHGVYNEFCP